MSNETTRPNAENRRKGRVVEVEREPDAPAVDEDAAAFLQEAAEAAAAAALEAEALASEVEEDAAGQAEGGAGPQADADGLAAEAADVSAEAAPEPQAGADELAAEAANDSAEAAPEPQADADELAAEATDLSAEPAPEADLDVALAEAGEALDAVDGAAKEAAAQAAEAAADEAQVEDATLQAFTEGDDRTDAELQAEMARELSDEAPTAEEQALAQAEEERDPEDDVAPAEISEAEAEAEEELQGSFDRIAAKARRLDEDQARHVIHSILFVADKPITTEQIRAATGLELSRVKASLERLQGELREGLAGVVLSEVAGGWQLRTAPESAEFVRRFLQVKPRRLTRAALETLAIIAYRQPVTRPEIEDIRGVDCGAVVKALLDWKLIKILGKKDEVGRPLLYGTSREFLEFFQLKDLASLPTLREYHELNEESVQIVEEELGPEAAAGIAGTVAELTDPAYLEAEKERVAKSEQALAELEQALADAEAKSTDVSQTINPPKAPEAPPEAEGEAEA